MFKSDEKGQIKNLTKEEIQQLNESCFTLCKNCNKEIRKEEGFEIDNSFICDLCEEERIEDERQTKADMDYDIMKDNLMGV